jgi:hypothetical protein
MDGTRTIPDFFPADHVMKQWFSAFLVVLDCLLVINAVKITWFFGP